MLVLDPSHSPLHREALVGARHIKLIGGISALPPELWAAADTLELLDVSGNQLHGLPDALALFGQLRTLFASNNPFTTLPAVLGRLPQLEMIGFKACQIRQVPEDSLPPRLRWLILTDNQLQALPESLGRCARLQKLMLSCNQLQALPASLAQCQRLALLRMASNRFDALPEVLFDLPQLAWLALAGNPMTQAAEQRALAEAAAPLQAEALQWHELLGEGASGQVHRVSCRASHCVSRQVGDAQAPAELAVKTFKAAHTSDGTPQSELAAGLLAGQHPRHPQLLTPLAAVAGLHDQQLAMALPLLPPGMQPLAGPPSFASCTRDVYAPDARWPAEVAQALLANVSSAVAHLHARGVLHGDVYAHNLLWQPATGDAVLSDFGAAALLHGFAPQQVAQLQQIEQRAMQVLRDEVLARVSA